MHYFLLDEVGDGVGKYSKEEAMHAHKVLRLKPGDVVGAVDGRGTYYEGPIAEIDSREVTFRITHTETNWGEPPLPTHLYLPVLAQRERLEWLLEKAVELGVTHLHFVHTARSSRNPPLNRARAERILVAGLKQCKRSRLPELSEPVPFTKAVEAATGLHVLAYCEATVPVGRYQEAIAAQPCSLWIGPEGDFTPEEAALAAAAGFQVVALGQTRLRCETAALHLLSLNKGWKGF